MLNTNKRGKLFTRRALILGGIKASLLMSLVARLYYLQVIKAEEYKTFSDSNRIKLFLIPPQRGRILDRDGRDLAGNRNYYRVLFDPDDAGDGKETVKRLAKVLGLDDKGYQRMLKKIEQHKSRRVLMLYEHLTWDEVAKVEVHSPDLPGISIDVAQSRFFPMATLSPHMIGYLGPVSEEEIKINPLLNHPDFKIGRTGVEKIFESTLRGKIGVRRMEVNAFGLAVSEISREESVPGQDVNLSLDKRLQQFIGERMTGLGGAAVVLDVTNGEVLAMSSSPGFDPNQFTYGVSSDEWERMTNDRQKPLINKAIANQYPPGSTFKLAVTLAALQEGVDPTKKVFCPGYVDLGRRRFHCWKKEGHGYMDMRDAIMHSCNTYFFTVSKRIGAEKISQIATQKFHLGLPFNIGLPGEKPGLVPNGEWKRARFNDDWQSGDTLNLGIGQGFMLSTPLQLAIMVARVASGKMVLPRLTPWQNDEHPVRPKFDSLGVPPEHLDLLRDGMYHVVNVPGGTAYNSRIQEEGLSMSGKTGTSQVISKKMLSLRQDNMSKQELEESKNHALFVAYGPVEDPRYALSVVVEHGGGGALAAAPVGRDIMQEAQKMDIVKANKV